ncbi:hypothetical protein ACFQT0_19225 [Hymenobacter humi]|uniref:Uncharacterized protein n=1 Tax=Hymenobacter humi TaxID=1411620 RepID=A0ABW2U718_9BACT
MYLGQNMPIKELSMVCEFYHPDALVTVLTTQPERTRIGEFAQELQQLCPAGRVVLYGNLARQEGLVLPPNFVAPPLMTDFMAMITENNLAPATA